MDKKHLSDQLQKLEIPFSTSLTDLICEGHDLWTQNSIEFTTGRPPHGPDAVVWPENEEQLSKLCSWASKYHIGLVPSGGLSSVTGSATAPSKTIQVSMVSMNRIIDFDSENMTVTCEAGISGNKLMSHLKKHGFTIGHIPSSINISTPGGWLSTGSAGVYSSRYGKIQDMCLEMNFIGGCGKKYHFSKNSQETNYMSLIIGSEGTMGFITSVKLRIIPLKSTMSVRAIYLNSLEDGFELMKRIMQTDTFPSILRLYDPISSIIAMNSGNCDLDNGYLSRILHSIKGVTPLSQLSHKSLPGLLKFYNSMSGIINKKFPYIIKQNYLLLAGFEGSDEDNAISHAYVESIGKDINFKKSSYSQGKKWFEAYANYSFKRASVFKNGIFVDTIEINSTWSKIDKIYNNINNILSRKAFVTAHFSHAWKDGCCIYFTFAQVISDYDQTIRLFREIWKEAADEIIRLGGTITHHHGIGRVKGNFFKKDTSDSFWLSNSVKRIFDPENIMNPGNMGFTSQLFKSIEDNF
ncbi:MAG: FAD-binding oxidoreductase [Deltaproteobacteria bacterium]|nr:FAD-binding oxidoreductase [Deltaproteobacteria bacterium]